MNMEENKENNDTTEGKEEKKAKEKPEEPATGDKKEGDVTETGSMLDRADAIRKGNEEILGKITEQVNRYEAAAARMMLSGKGEAGTPQKTPEKEAEEKVDAEVKEMLDTY